MAKANLDSGPKRKDDDCDMVTSLQASDLSKNEMCLHEAARENQVELLRKIIRRNAANINCKNNLDRTALHMAAARGHLEAAELIVNKGKAVVDATDKYGMTPFLWAAYFGNLEVLTFLAEKGASINKKNKQGRDVIHLASEGDFVDVLRYMYRKHKHMKIDDQDNNGLTPFLLAVSKNSINASRSLAENDCSLIVSDKNDRNAVHWTAICGHDEILRLLIEVETPEEMYSAKDDKQRTPLICAAEHGHIKIVEILIERLVNLEDTTDENQMTALHYATQNNRLEIVEFLVKSGAKINSKNVQGNTPLHLATLGNLAPMVSLLLSLGADMSITNNREQTPLHSGVEQNKCDSVEVLLLKGAKLDGIDKTGKTPLLMAARGSYIAMVDMLIKAYRYNKTKAAIYERQQNPYPVRKSDTREDKLRPPDYTNVYDIQLEELIKAVLEDPSYRLKEFNQPYAEEFKLYLWKVAFNHLRFGEWKKLAQYWGFLDDQILAIEYQQVQNNSYKYHGYRVLCIWFHGVESNETPIRGLYEALVAIGRRKLAHHIRRELDVTGSKGLISSNCVIS